MHPTIALGQFHLLCREDAKQVVEFSDRKICQCKIVPGREANDSAYAGDRFYFQQGIIRGFECSWVICECGKVIVKNENVFVLWVLDAVHTFVP